MAFMLAQIASENLTVTPPIPLYPQNTVSIEDITAAVRVDQVTNRAYLLELINQIAFQDGALGWTGPRIDLFQHLLDTIKENYSLDNPLLIADNLLGKLKIPEAGEAIDPVRQKALASNIYLLREIFTILRDIKSPMPIVRYLYHSVKERTAQNRDLLTKTDGSLNLEYLDILLFLDAGYDPSLGIFPEDAQQKIEPYLDILESQVLFDPLAGIEFKEAPTSDVADLHMDTIITYATNLTNLTWLLTEFDRSLTRERPLIQELDSNARRRTALDKQIRLFTGLPQLQNSFNKVLDRIPETNISTLLKDKLLKVARLGNLLNIPTERFYNNLLNCINNMLILGIIDQDIEDLAKECLSKITLISPDAQAELLDRELRKFNSRLSGFWNGLLEIKIKKEA